MEEVYTQAKQAINRLIDGLTARALMADEIAYRIDRQYNGNPPQEQAEKIAQQEDRSFKAWEQIKALEAAIAAIEEAEKDE